MGVRLCLYSVGAIVGGQVGVAIGVVVASALCIPVVIFCLMSCFDLRVSDFVRALWRPVPAGLAMVLVVRLLQPDSLSIPILRLFIDITVGASVFALTLLALWHISGRQAGIESRVLATISTKLKSMRN